MSINPLNDISRVYLEQVASQQLDELTADYILAASKEAGKRAGTLAALSAGDPKVKAKAVRKREQSERLYKKQAKKRVVNIKPIEEENVEEGVRPTPVNKPLNRKEYEKRRKSLAGREESDAAEKRGHVGKEWHNTGRKYSPDEAKSRRKNMSDTHRSLSYGTAESPDDNEGYPAVKTKNPKKLRKQKAMGEIGESSHLETDMEKRRKANEKAIEDMKKTKAHKDMVAAAKKKFDEEYVDEALRSREERMARMITPAKRKQQERTRQGREILADIQATERALKQPKSSAPSQPTYDTPAAEVRVLKPGQKKDTLAMKAKKAMGESKSNDGNLANNYPPYDKVTRGDVIAGALGKDQMGGKKKKKSVKEGYSNWREDLIEVVDKINKDKNDEKVTDKEVDNGPRIKINPTFGEAVENLGGTLLEMVEIEDLEGVLDEMSESEIFLLNDDLIEEVVEEVFAECIAEGYDVYEIENVLLESLELSTEILNEAEVTLGHDTQVKSDRLAKVKSAVKRVGGAIARGAGYVAGAAVRGVRAAGREFSAGYQRGRQGSGGGSSSGSSGSSGSGSSTTSSSGSSDSGSSTSSSQSGSSRPGLLGRIGSALKSGLKRVVAKGARAVSRGARNVARRMEGGSSSTSSTSSTPTSTASAKPKVTQGHQSKVTQGRGAEPTKPTSTSSATTPPKVTTKKVQTPAPKAQAQAKPAPKAQAKPAPKSRRGKLSAAVDDALPSIRSEQVQIDELSNRTVSNALNARIAATGAAADRAYKHRNPEAMRAAETAASKEARMRGAVAKRRMRMSKEEFQIDEKTLTAAETEKKKEIYSSVTLDKLRKQYPEKSEKELESLRFAISTSMAKKIAEQALGMQAPAQEPKEKPLDTAAERQKFANLRTMQQKHQQLQKQRLNLQKQGKLPLENEFYEPEGEVLDERRRSEKGTPRKPRDPAFEYVAKMMGSSRLGVQPRGQKKVPGKKPPAAGEYGAPASPAQKVAKRRADAQTAQELMHSRFD